MKIKIRTKKTKFLIQFLFQLYLHNEYIVAQAAIKATSSSSELDVLAPSLVNAFAASKDIFGLLAPLMKEEVESTGKEHQNRIKIH